MPQKAFSKTPNKKPCFCTGRVWILVVVAVIIAAGILVWWQLQTPAEVEQPADETANLPAKASATEGWKTYRNEEYGFEVKYPSSFLQTDEVKRFLTRGQSVAAFAAQEFNHLNFSVFHYPFMNYKLVDNAGGYIFRFDTIKGAWVHESGQTSEFVPKRGAVSLESYIYKTGDINCHFEIMLIPHPSYSFVVEIEETVCDILDKSSTPADYIKNPLDLTPEQMLSTFRFLDPLRN